MVALTRLFSNICSFLLPILTFSVQLPENAVSKSYQDHQNALNRAAQGLNEASSELVSASRGTPEQLSAAAIKFSKDFQELMDAGVGMARTAPVSIDDVISSSDMTIAYSVVLDSQA